MSSPRLRRLKGDLENIQRDFNDHKQIRVIPNGANPPDKYRVIYNIPGIMWDATRQCPIESTHHEVEIFLPPEYPRDKPKCVALTPIFHPNFGDFVCIGDFWVAGMNLTDIVLQIGNMIQYRLYNVRSPLNAVAARWTKENENLFPIGKVELVKPDEVGGKMAAADVIEISLGGRTKDQVPLEKSTEAPSDELEIVLVKKHG